MAKQRNALGQTVSRLKALSDEGRLRVYLALCHGELCVCQITELLGLAPSTVSKHMTILKQASLVESRKDGRWIYYRYAEPRPPFESALVQTLSDDAIVKADLVQLSEILNQDPVELCKKQCRK